MKYLIIILLSLSITSCYTIKKSSSTSYKNTIINVHLNNDTVYKVIKDTVLFNIKDTIVVSNDISKVQLYKLPSGQFKITLVNKDSIFKVPTKIPVITNTIIKEKRVYPYKLIILLIIIIILLYKFRGI